MDTKPSDAPNALDLHPDIVAARAETALAEAAAARAKAEAILSAQWSARTETVTTSSTGSARGAESPPPVAADRDAPPLSPDEAIRYRDLDATVAQHETWDDAFTEIPDPVADRAAAVFAETAVDVALAQEIALARPLPPPSLAEASKPVSQAVSDWAPAVQGNDRVLHVLMGIGDPVASEAQSALEEAAVEAQLSAVIAAVPGGEGAAAGVRDGQLAALAAFDDALARGADSSEALAAAIAAAEGAPAPALQLTRSEAPVTEEVTGAVVLPRAETTTDLAGPSRSGTQATGQGAGEGGQRSNEPTSADFDAVIVAGLSETLQSPPSFTIAGSGFGFRFDFDPVSIPQRGPSALSGLLRARDRDDPVATATPSGRNNFQGSADADLLVGTAGADALGGLESDDYLYAETPTNYDAAVHSAASPLTSPTFSNVGADDIVSGGAGDDFLWGGAGDDQLHGDVPDTSLLLFSEFGFGLGPTTGGNDEISGGTGKDTLYGGTGDDKLYGEDDDDTLYGGDGADTLEGGAGDDLIEGNAGIDTLYGQAGSDNLFGYAGDDVVRGGEGNDELSGGTGADSFQFAGGSGADALAHAQSLGTDTVNDYSAADNDTFALSDADFSLGNSGSLTDGTDYFEHTTVNLSTTPTDVSSGVTGPAIVVMGQNTGSDGVAVYYTNDPSAMTTANSYQIADIVSVNMGDVEAADFLLQS